LASGDIGSHGTDDSGVAARHVQPGATGSHASFAVAAFVLKLRQKTRDPLFLELAAAFIIEGVNRFSFLLLPQPNEGAALIDGVRLFSYVLIPAAIVHENRTWEHPRTRIVL
jgi:hypothetical protein